jgi:hypothetical protein
VFEAPQVVARAEKMGDLFEPVLNLKQKLPDVKGLLAGVGEAAAKASEPERIDLAAQAEARPTPAARVQPKKAATKKRTGNKAANKFERKPVAKDGKKPSLTAAKSGRRV